MFSLATQALAFSSTLVLSAMFLPAGAQTGTPAFTVDKGYSISVFAKGVPKGVAGSHTEPDSVTVSGDKVYVAWGNGNLPTGVDAKPSQIFEYSKDGHVLHTYNVIGHNDGLKVDPVTHKVWALQNQDANSNLVIIDPKTQEQTLYTYNQMPAGGGGYDDVTFRNGQAYLSASNPSTSPNTLPAIVKVKLVGNTVDVSPVLEGNATATNVVTGTPTTLNLSDPDSLTTTPNKDLLLSSQGDNELVLVSKVGSMTPSAVVIPLSSPLGTPTIDDTLFIPSSDGFILVTDTPTNTVYAIHKTAFTPGTAYSGGTAGTTTTVGFVGKLDLESGFITPVITGLQSPHGMAFVNSHANTSDDGTVPCQVDE